MIFKESMNKRINRFSKDSYSTFSCLAITSTLDENTSNKSKMIILTFILEIEHFTLMTQYLLVIFKIINNVCHRLPLTRVHVFMQWNFRIYELFEDIAIIFEHVHLFHADALLLLNSSDNDLADIVILQLHKLKTLPNLQYDLQY